jgi:serine/threonine protein kinase
VKEAALLNSTKGHRNIIRFLGFCEEPYSIMMEYSSPFYRVAKSLCTLFVDDEFDFASFADLLPTCAKDVVAGLKHLHTKNIADEFCISIRI